MSEPIYPDFPKNEHNQRWSKAKELMRQKALDAIFISDHTNFAYLTGHQTILYGSKARPLCLILPLEGEPICVLNTAEIDNHNKTNWVRESKFYEIDPKTQTFNPVNALRDAFKELGLDDGIIGCELGFEQRLGITYNDFIKLQKTLSNAKFVDASSVIWNLRMIKSEAEIKRLEKVCELTSIALDQTFETIRKDMTETEVRKILYTNMIQYGADKPEIIMFAGCTPPLEIKLKKNKSLILDVSASYKGYSSDITRTAFIGKAKTEHKKDFERAMKATDACIDMFKPGIKVNEIHKACPISSPPEARIGHGIGREGTEPPSISGYDETVLKPGMVLSIEPSVDKAYGSFKIEEDIVITEDGCRILSTAKKELWEI